MPLLDVGRNFYVAAMLGEAVTPFNEANAHIAVGDSDTAVSAGQTDLQATTNKFRAPMDFGYPTRTNNVATFQAVFEGDEANFTWNEWAIANASSGGVCLVREVEEIGTKLAGQTWILRVELTTLTGS